MTKAPYLEEANVSKKIRKQVNPKAIRKLQYEALSKYSRKQRLYSLYRQDMTFVNTTLITSAFWVYAIIRILDRGL